MAEIATIDARLVEELIRSVGLDVDQVFGLTVELPGTLVVEYHKRNENGNFYSEGDLGTGPRVADGREIRQLIWNRDVS
jgi:hypothetical protein